MTAPVVSVVTSVYQGREHLRASLESVLAQELRDLELVVIDDGSRDGSAELLRELSARDPRVRVLRQENQGLTRSLVRGCAEARGEFIARHDADDRSEPARLARQVERLRADPSLAFVSCFSRMLGPRGELLLEITRPAEAAEATGALFLGRAGPPGHGSVTFRADAYRRAGGYRPAFRFAQDADLWLRLAEQGRLAYVPEFLYAFGVAEDGTSAERRAQQRRLHALALGCRAARARGASEDALLAEAARVSAEPPPATRRFDPGNSYFIGKCLLDRRDRRCFGYLRRSASRRPWSFRPWAALALAALVLGRASDHGPAR